MINSIVTYTLKVVSLRSSKLSNYFELVQTSSRALFHTLQAFYDWFFITVNDLVNEVSYHWEGFSVQRQSFHGFSISNLRKHEKCFEPDYVDTEGHSCAKAIFTLHRQLGHFLIRVYGPSLLIVITTFIGFWIPAQGYPARVCYNLNYFSSWLIISY